MTSLCTSSLSTRRTARSQRSAQLFITADTTSSSRGPPAAHALFRPSPSRPPLSSPASAGRPTGAPHFRRLGLAPVARSSQAVSVPPSLARTPRPSPSSCSAPLCDGHLLPCIPFLGSGPHACVLSARVCTGIRIGILFFLLILWRPIARLISSSSIPHTGRVRTPHPRAPLALVLLDTPLPPSTQRTAARAPQRPSPSGTTSPVRAPPRNPCPSHPSPVLHRAPWAASPSCLRRPQASRVDGSLAPVISIRAVIVHSTSRPRIQLTGGGFADSIPYRIQIWPALPFCPPSHTRLPCFRLRVVTSRQRGICTSGVP
ncbi:hypothetical protein B0H14DRAFT_720458 [Mycena olivaceomarginata]|nr:hypothetical protein B0H14DRAFT_720458 [Mycena olivaceomarginata]